MTVPGALSLGCLEQSQEIQRSGPRREDGTCRSTASLKTGVNQQVKSLVVRVRVAVWHARPQPSRTCLCLRPCGPLWSLRRSDPRIPPSGAADAHAFVGGGRRGRGAEPKGRSSPARRWWAARAAVAGSLGQWGPRGRTFTEDV